MSDGIRDAEGKRASWMDGLPTAESLGNRLDPEQRKRLKQWETNLERIIHASPDSGSPEAEARDRLAVVGFAETERRITALKSTLRAARAENAGLREFLDCFQVYREAVEMGANRECVENEYQRTKNAADEALTALTAPTPASSEFVRGLKRAAEDRAWAAANGGEEQR
jgi:hypothetical protein